MDKGSTGFSSNAATKGALCRRRVAGQVLVLVVQECTKVLTMELVLGAKVFQHE